MVTIALTAPGADSPGNFSLLTVADSLPPTEDFTTAYCLLPAAFLDLFPNFGRIQVPIIQICQKGIP